MRPAPTRGRALVSALNSSPRATGVKCCGRGKGGLSSRVSTSFENCLLRVLGTDQTRSVDGVSPSQLAWVMATVVL